MSDLRRLALIRFLRFNAIGSVNIFFKLALLAALREWGGLNYLVATAIAVEISILHGFAWHQVWTWSERDLDRGAMDVVTRALRYNLATGVLAVIVNVGVVRLLVTSLRMNYLVAGALATPCAGLLCFLISDAFIFVRPKTPEAAS